MQYDDLLKISIFQSFEESNHEQCKYYGTFVNVYFEKKNIYSGTKLELVQTKDVLILILDISRY